MTTSSNSYSTTGLVVSYDTKSIQNYKGPALQNVANQITPRGLSDGTYYKFISGSELVYIPGLGDINSKYVDMWNDYTNSNTCCPSPYGYGDGLTVSSGTQYTYGIVYKSVNRYHHPNYMYHYEFNSSGSYITEYGVHMQGGYSPQETHLGDDWYWSRSLFTTNANCVSINTGCWMYQYNTFNRLYIAKVLISPGNWSELHPVHWPEIGTTRGSGSILKNTGITQQNINIAGGLSYTTSGNPSFNGSSSYVSAGDLSSWINSGNYTVELLFKPYQVTNYRNPFDASFGGGNYGPRLEMNDSGNLVWVSGNTGGSYTSYTVRSSGLESGIYHHVVLTLAGNVIKTYYNGVLVTNTTDAYPNNTDRFYNVNIGRGFSTSGERWFSGEIPVVRIYSRAFSDTEVYQNYLSLKPRYGL